MTFARDAQASEESVHDLRISIRRLSECLRTFEHIFAKGQAGQLRRKLRKLMDLAAEVRNRDISGQLFREAGVPESHAAFARLHAEKEMQRRALLAKLEQWTGSKRPEHWRAMVR